MIKMQFNFDLIIKTRIILLLIYIIKVSCAEETTSSSTKCTYSPIDCLNEHTIEQLNEQLNKYTVGNLDATSINSVAISDANEDEIHYNNSSNKIHLIDPRGLPNDKIRNYKSTRDIYLDVDHRGLSDRSRPPRAPETNDHDSVTSSNRRVRRSNSHASKSRTRDILKTIRGVCDDGNGVCTLSRGIGNDPNSGTRAAPLRSNNVKIQTKLGVITGTRELSKPAAIPSGRGRPFYSFRGIPYAEPPTGDLRWSPPVLLDKRWQGGFIDASQFKSFCPQYDHDHKMVVGDEDCLYLNIYTPFLKHETNTRLPVLVFIHGGFYTRGGASSHGPERLMTENIVVVTMNYRLGVLGFLSTGAEDLPGNYGALDQVAALQWVSQFIEYFNGDSTQVTLGGFSAGASLVHLHIMSSLSQGLFHRAILMSGSGNCQWSVQPKPLEVAIQLAEDLECPLPPGEEYVTCLREKSTEDLIKAQTDRHRYVHWPFLYRPVVDGGIRESPFLSAPVEELMLSSPTSSVPVLGGATQFEGLLFALTTLLFSSNPTSPSEVYDEATLYLLGSLWPNETTRDDVAAALHSFYYSPSAKISLDMLLEQMTEAMTDQIITSCMWDALDHLASTRLTPVYSYLMTHHDPSSPAFAHPLYRLAHNHGVRSPLLQSAASHGDDVILIFNFPHNQVEPGPRDLQMSAILTNMWANFVKSGSPVSGRLSTGVPPWKPISSGNPLTYYRLSLTPGTVTRPFRSKERNLWQQTVLVAEHISEEKVELESSVWSYQLATWILTVLCIFFLILLLLLCAAICMSRRRKKYSARGATLRSNQPRSSSYGPPNNRSNGVADS